MEGLVRQQAVETIRTDLRTSGFIAISQKIPSKIIELQHINQTLSKTYCLMQESSSLASPSSRKKRKFADTDSEFAEFFMLHPRPGQREDHAQKYVDIPRPKIHDHSELHKTLKQECEELLQLTDQIRMWITLTQFENTAESSGIRDDLISELHIAQQSALNMRGAFRVYYTERGKLCSKIAKYPNILDYRFALEEHDEHQLFLVHQYLRDIQNIYIAILEVIEKTAFGTSIA